MPTQAVERLISINTDGIGIRQIPKSRYDACRLVCAICPGYCCYRFSMRMPRKKNGHLDHKAIHAAWPDNPEELAAADFIQAHIHPCRTPKAMNRWGSVAMRCDCHDPKTRMCSEYNERPSFCRKYFCNAALDGRVPGRESFPHQIKMMIRAGVLKSAEVPKTRPTIVRSVDTDLKAELADLQDTLGIECDNDSKIAV
jgi:hypothetical protein